MLDDDDPQMRKLAEEEFANIAAQIPSYIDTDFPALIAPPSTSAKMSALMELKSGVGGSESSLFLGEVLRMYQRVAQVCGWHAKVVSRNELDAGGLKDAVVEVTGEGGVDGRGIIRFRGLLSA